MRLIVQNHERLVAQLLLEQRMRELADTDELTGLFNRRALKNAMTPLIAAEQPLALILLDLDGFKAVNDQYGHGAGDQLLQEIGQRLCTAAPAPASVARLGGDEFAILLPGGDQASARSLADRALLALVKPIALPAATVRIGASAGVASAVGETSINALFSEADGALYAAKRGPIPDLHRTLSRRAARA
jgi:diguanylate cyclase